MHNCPRARFTERRRIEYLFLPLASFFIRIPLDVSFSSKDLEIGVNEISSYTTLDPFQRLRNDYFNQRFFQKFPGKRNLDISILWISIVSIVRIKFDSRKWPRSINGTTTVPDNCFTTRSPRMTTRSENRRSRYSWSDVRCSLRKQSGATGRGEGRGERARSLGKEWSRGGGERRELSS